MGEHRFYFLIFFLLTLSLPLRAELESTSVLPKGVRSPKVIFGLYTGLSERFNSSGLIQGVADQYHINLTGPTMASLSPEIRRGVNLLNNLTPNERLGDEFSAGTLDFKSTPSVDFLVPTISYGLTDKISVGVGIPIIHFRNEMQIVTGGVNNIDQIEQQVHGISEDEKKIFNDIRAASQDMTGTINSILEARGYKPIRTVEFTTLGDLQLSAVYRYYANDYWSLALRPYLVLPTGRKDDPDDLVDQAVGGQTAVGLYSIHEYRLTNNLTATSALGYQANLQDTADVRVPIDASDLLPDIDRKETVRRKIGNTAYAELGARYQVMRPLELATFYDMAKKDPDWFDGDRAGWNYRQLSNDTASQIHKVYARLEFSTVDWYAENAAAIPMMVGYVFGNTIWAENAPRQIEHQFYLRAFF